MAAILASDVNALFSMYNSALGTNLPTVTTGSPILASDWLGWRNAIASAAQSQGYYVALPDPSHFVKGQPILLEQWGSPVLVVGTTVLSQKNGSWTVPAGCTSVMFNWIVAGGGGGAAGTNYNNGSGGAGGGSGGFLQYQQVTCAPGDVFSWTIGQGGQPGSGGSVGIGGAGSSGGDTVVTYTPVGSTTATEIFRVTGGQGGAVWVPGHTVNPIGGLGGSPGGLQGQWGEAGASNYAQNYGGSGAPGALQGCLGGSGGSNLGGDVTTGASVGKPGVGPGSGGGGGGNGDKGTGVVGTNYWAGGQGAPGCIEWTYPSAGATGGTPAANNSAYTAYPSTFGAYTGGAGTWSPGSGITTTS